MTTGSATKGAITTPPKYYNGSPSGTGIVGQRFKRTWTGTDNQKLPRGPRERKSYVTLSNTGKLVKRYYFATPFAEKKRKKILPPNAYSVTYETLIHDVGTFINKRHIVTTGELYDQFVWTGTSFEGIYATPVVPAPVVGANDDIRLVNKLKDRVRGNDFNLAVFLGEGNQTLRLIGDTAVSIASAIRSARKGNFKKALDDLAQLNGQRSLFRSPRRQAWEKQLAKKREVAANKWLEVQYGILPLLGDMHDGAEFLAHHMNTPHTVRHDAQIYLKTDQSSVVDADGRKYGQRFSSTRKRVIAYISEQESLPKLLGLMDPQLVLWELIPFSFVFDWVIPIGSWLEARAFASGLTGSIVTTVTTVSRTSNPSFNVTVSGGLRTTVTLNGGMTYNTVLTKSVTRTLGALPVPLPAVKGLEKVASWQHCANGIALLTNLGSKR